MALKQGDVLQNRYRIVSILGRGGMGSVYCAQHTQLDASVAVKEMIPQPGLDSQTLAQLREQFRQEAQILARLDHPHLVRVSDFFEEKGNAYLVMDFVEGESLAERIEQDGAMSEENVLTWAEQLLDALAYCHAQGIIHRDIKPQNVIIRPDGRAVLVDFGLVKLWDPNDPRTKTQMRGMGTPEYAPPEQYEVQMGHTDARSDVYGLGATLYHALVGQAPATATMRIADPEEFGTLRDAAPDISENIEKAVMKSLELARSQRWQNAAEMAKALGVAVPEWEDETDAADEESDETPREGTRKMAGGLDSEEAVMAPAGAGSAQAKVASAAGAWAVVALAVLTLIFGLLVTSSKLIPLGTLPDLTPTPSRVPTATPVVYERVEVEMLALIRIFSLTWPYFIGITGLGLLLCSTILILSHHSGLPVSLLIRQKVKILQVALQYPDYYNHWQSQKLLTRLITLLEVEKPDVSSIAQTLRSLRVPVTDDQVADAMELAIHEELLSQDGDYHWANPVLLKVLRVDVGSSTRLALADQIRRDNLLFKKARQFLKRAGSNLTLVERTSIYRCQLPASLQRCLPEAVEAVYAWVAPGERMDGDYVLSIRTQVRAFNILKALVLIITDQRPTDQGWAQIGTLRMEGLTILPIEGGLIDEGLVNGNERLLLRQEIEDRLGTEYDPYDVRDPVSEAFSFFGRGALLENLVRRLEKGNQVGIFGLRKLGKSSLLLALRNRTLFPVALVNLQTVGNAALSEMYARILRYWKKWTQVRYALRVDMPEVTTSDPTGSFIAATLALLEQLETHQVKARLGLFLDEVELIVPRSNGSSPDLTRYLTLMRAVRGLVDEDGRLSVIVASLNNSITRINRWKGEQNPTFNFFQEIYLPPLRQNDCIQMVRNIGRQIGLVYDDASVETIADLSGGHPFLARQFCSLLYQQRDRQPGQIDLDAIPSAIEHFIYDEQTVTHLDAGIWQDAGNISLWGEEQARVNQEILLDLARADKPLTKEALLEATDADTRRAALISLERFHFIHQPEPGYYALRYGLLRVWLRRRKLGLEGN